MRLGIGRNGGVLDETLGCNDKTFAPLGLGTRLWIPPDANPLLRRGS
jgi:hypothetical protein